VTRHRSDRCSGAAVALVAAVAATAVVVAGVWFVGTSALTTEPTGAQVSSPSDPGRATASAQQPSPTQLGELVRAPQTDAFMPVAPLASSDPDRLVVPALGLDVDVLGLGLTTAGSLEVPSAPFPAGWYTGSPTPGEVGPAVIAGHVSYNGAPGVFEDLSRLRPGDEIQVVREDGTTAPFVVTRTADYDKTAFPTEAVYGDIAHAGLRLITCGGLDPASGVFEENLVVYAELVDHDPRP
jgi:hypothetical protein